MVSNTSSEQYNGAYLTTIGFSSGTHRILVPFSVMGRLCIVGGDLFLPMELTSHTVEFNGGRLLLPSGGQFNTTFNFS